MLGSHLDILFFVLISTLKSSSGLPWLLGCLHGNLPSDLLAPVSPASSAACLEACLLARYDFAVYQSDDDGGGCFYTDGIGLRHLLRKLEADDNQWNFVQHGEPPADSCHGDGSGNHTLEAFTSSDVVPLAAVFLCQGPEVRNITLSNPSTLYAGLVITIQAIVEISAWEPPYGVNVSHLRLWTKWHRNDNISYTENVLVTWIQSDEPGKAISTWVHLFPDPGQFDVGIIFSTGADHVAWKTRLTVSPPIPSGLVLIVHPGTAVATPTCIPSHLVDSPKPSFLVFSHQKSLLQASLSSGADVVFDWQFGNGTVFVRDAGRGEHHCLGLDCRRSIMEHVFDTEGVHSVTVKVSSPYGSLQETFNVVAVDWKLEDLSLSLKEDGLLQPFMPVHFLIALTTSNCESAWFHLELGDGSLLQHPLKEVGTLEKTRTRPNLLVTGNYGTGCRLSFEVRHVYKIEGNFLVNATIADGTFSLSAALPLQVYCILQGPIVQGDKTIAARELVNFTLSLQQDSEFRQGVTWMVFGNGSDPLMVENTYNTTWQYAFHEVGHYTIRASVVNPSGSTFANHTLVVQSRVQGLIISSLLPSPVVRVHQNVTFQAYFQEGTNVSCSWNFTCYCISCLQSWDPSNCRVSYTFPSVDHCFVAVVARNLVSEQQTNLSHPILIQEEVAGVHATVTFPVLLGEIITVSVFISQGSDVRVYAIFQDSLPIPATYNSSAKVYTVKKSAMEHGSIVIVIRAYNNVSSVDLVRYTRVMSPIGKVAVAPRGCRLISSPVLLIATIDGLVPGDLDQFMYAWRVGNSSLPNYTSVPIFDITPSTLEEIEVSLSVSNEVDIQTAKCRVQVQSSISDPCLQHFAAVVASSMVTFSLVMEKKNNILLHYWKIENSTAPINTDIFYAGDGKYYSWSHIFISPGLKHISVLFTNSTGNITLNSICSVQLHLESLTIIGPRIVPVTGFPVLHSWEAHPQIPGTIYEWNTSEEKIITMSNKFSSTVPLPGKSIITLKAWNLFSTVQTYHQVDAVLIVQSLEAFVPNPSTEEDTTFCITMQGGGDINLFISFGDGKTRSIKHQNSAIITGIPTLEFQVHHRYFDVGNFYVWMNASNDISWLTHSVSIVVQEPISGIKLTLLSQSLVSLLEEVIVKVTVESGTDLMYTWDFGDDSGDLYTIVKSEGNTSTARHTYSIANTYLVTVKVWNSLLKEPIIASLNIPIQAVEQILQLDLRPVANHYAAPLFEEDASSFTSAVSTKPILFEARVWRGSDVCFIFDFGDGHQEEIPAVVDVWSATTGVALHAFKTEGTFLVSVTAKNPLGSVRQKLSQPFFVQFPPQDLMLNEPHYIASQGSVVYLHASVSKGTNVSFDWTIGEDIHLSNAGSSVPLSFLKADIYNVTVEAYNNVTDLAYDDVMRPCAFAKIYIQEPLQGIELCVETADQRHVCEGGDLELPTDEVYFEARVLPETKVALRFIWALGTGELRRTNSHRLTHLYRDPGKYVVNVTAQNHVSSASSGAIKLHFVQKVGNLTAIRYQGSILIDHPVIFHALYWFGTNLTFEWQFGDDESPFQTQFSSVQHTYSKIGEYWVKVVAWNKFSQAEISTNIFVLDQPCQKPEIKFVDQSKKRKYSEDIQLEADISTSCSITSHVIYTWSLQKNGEIFQTDTSPDTWHQRELLIPRGFLPEGEYNIELRVGMNGTMVYSTEKTIALVELSPLTVSIKGGILRKIGRHEDVTVEACIMNETGVEDQNVSFSWVCSGLFESVSCFTASAPDFSSQNLKVLSGSLNADLKFILFNVTVKQGKRKAIASQVLEVVDSVYPLLIKVICTSCPQNQVNVDNQLIFEAACDNCGHLYLNYTWHLWIIEDGNHNLQIGEFDCVQADGSTFYIITANLTSSTPSYLMTNEWDPQKIPISIEVASSVPSVQDELPPFPSLPGFPDESIVKYKSEDHGKRRTLRDDWKAERNKNPPVLLLLPPVEGEAEYDNFTNPSEYFGIQDLPSGLRPHYHFSEHDFPVTEEGLPGEGGSAAARDQSLKHFGKNLLGSAEEQNKIMEGQGMGRGGAESGHSGILLQQFPFDSHKGDPVKNDKTAIRTSAHVVQRIRKLVSLHSYDTINGAKSRYFTLKSGVLRVGSTYLVEVIATAKENSSVLSGSAMYHISVNIGPMNGRCTLMPTTGHEFETQFRLHCLEWQSKNLPLFYELRYSLLPEGPSHLIYFGQNRNVKFVLPSGLPSFNYSVYLDVMVRDSRGAGTKVCSIVREVYPYEWINGVNLNHYVFNATFHPKSSLNKMVGEKHIQGILHLIHALMTSINQQARAHKINSEHLTSLASSFQEKVRHFCLQTISNLIFFSKAEAVQVLSAVSAIIQSPNNISVGDLRLSLSIIQKIYSKFATLGGQFPSSQVIEELLKVISQVFDCSMLKIIKSKTEESGLGRDIDKLRSLFFQILKVALKNIVQHEEPLLLQTQYLSAATGYITPYSHFPYVLDMGLTKIILYKSILSTIRNLGSFNNTLYWDPAKNEFCVAVLTESSSHSHFKSTLLSSREASENNPAFYHVASLSFLTCKGFIALKSSGISFIQDAEVHLLRRKQQRKDKLYSLQRSDMHVHVFNISSNHLNWSLQINVKLSNVNKDKHGFPLQMILSKLEPPRLDNYLLKKSFDDKSTTIQLFIPQNVITEPEVFFLGIVDADYNEGYHHKNVVSSRNYSLYIWCQQCLQWNKKTWTPDGCLVMNTSGQDSIHCRCSHLSGVDILSSNVSTRLLILPAQHLLHSAMYFTPIILMSVLLITYIILLIPAYRTDNKMINKPTLMSLKDNDFELWYKYLVSIETGYYHGSGTTAVVSMELHGEKGMSKAIQLIGKDSNNVFCQQSSTDTFLLHTNCCLGPLLRVHLWHNNAGSDPSWYLKDLTITDLLTGHHYYFPCEQWFSVEEEDGLIERELFVSECVWNFLKILKQRCIYYLHDAHLWTSVYYRPPHSLFTHVQRLTCCFSLILTSASLVAVWYCYYSSEYNSDSNHLDFSFSSLFVGAAVSVIAMIPHNLLGVIFRFSQSPQPLWTTFQKLFCKLYTWATSYCWLKHKYSNPTNSINGSSMLESTESIYQSYPHSLDYQSRSIETSEEEKNITDELLSLSSFLRGSLSPLAETLSNWHAFENWARQKHQEFYNSSEDLPDCDSLIHQQNGGINYELVVKERTTSETIQINDKHTRLTQRSSEMAHAVIINKDYHLHEISSQQSSSGFEDWLGSEVMNKAIGAEQDDGNSHCNKDFSTFVAKSVGILLPTWVYFCGYFILVITVCTSACVTLILSNSFEILRATYWLNSLFVSIMCSVFIHHPLMVLIVALISTLRSRYLKLYPHEQHAHIATILHSFSEEHEKGKCDSDASWQRKASNNFYQYFRPPPEPILIEARRKMIKFKRFMNVMREFLMSLFTWTLLIFMTCGKDITTHYYHSEAVQNAYVRLPSSSLLEITSHRNWWTWMHNDFLNTYYETQNCTGIATPLKYCLDSETAGSFPIGKPSIRQFRASSQLCSEPLLAFSSFTCGLSGSQEDPRKYDETNKIQKFKSLSQNVIDNDNYTFQQSTPLWGHFGVYKVTDIFIQLSENKNESSELLKHMEEINWLDRHSRAVVVDFLLFNPTFTLFTSVSLLVEFPAAGGAVVTPFIFPCHLYLSITKWDFTVMVCEWAFISISLWHLKSKLWKIMKLGKQFWKSPWNWTQVIIGMLSICYGVCYFHRFSMVNTAIQSFHEYHQHLQIDVSRVAAWDQVLQTLLGLLLFIHMISWLHFLQLNNQMSHLIKVISIVWKEIGALQAVLLFIMLGYSIIGNLLFGTKGGKCSSPLMQCLHLLRSLLRGFQNSGHLEIFSIDFYKIIFMTTALLSFFLITALMRALLIISKRKTQMQRMDAITFMNAVHFIKEAFMKPFLKERINFNRDDLDEPPATEFLLLELETLVDHLKSKADKLFSNLNPSLSNLSLTSDCQEYSLDTEKENGCSTTQDELMVQDTKPCLWSQSNLSSVDARCPSHMPLPDQLTYSCDESCEPWSTTSNGSLDNSTVNIPINHISKASLSAKMKPMATAVQHLSNKNSPISLKSFQLYSWNDRSNSSWNSVTPSRRHYRVRKTFPIHPVETSSSELHDISMAQSNGGLSIRKTKSCGKGKNHNFAFRMAPSKQGSEKLEML